jgi:hypothetical protein
VIDYGSERYGPKVLSEVIWLYDMWCGACCTQVGIIMGSDSDLPTMKEAAEMLEQFGVKYELTVVSAHRTPTRMYSYAQTAAQRGVQVGDRAHHPMLRAESCLGFFDILPFLSSVTGRPPVSVCEARGGHPSPCGPRAVCPLHTGDHRGCGRGGAPSGYGGGADAAAGDRRAG